MQAIFSSDRQTYNILKYDDMRSIKCSDFTRHLLGISVGNWKKVLAFISSFANDL